MKECIAMLLAGGQGSRLYALTRKLAKPAVPFGGKYRIIDFPLSNCVNSGIDTVGILTQYQPLVLNDYIGNGQPWDLDRLYGGVHVLPPYQTATGSDSVSYTHLKLSRQCGALRCNAKLCAGRGRVCDGAQRRGQNLSLIHI